MQVWAVVPVKPLKIAKSRLSGSLSAAGREELVRRLLEHTLQVLSDCRGIQQILVVSADPQVWEICLTYERVNLLREEDVPGLNASLERASAFAVEEGAEAVMIVPLDLPLLNNRLLQDCLELSGPAPLLLIAPDRQKLGTNFLLSCPPGLIPFSFGENSFQTHQEAARKTSAAVKILDIPELALDIDTPADLEQAGF